MRWLGIDPDNALAFADGDSDIPLFDAVGMGVAMANASPALKARTPYMTGNVLEYGLQKGIERYL